MVDIFWGVENLAGQIAEVLPNSIAEELELAAGDRLLKINGKPLADLIDYRYYCAEEELELEVEKADGEIWLCEVEKDADEDLGLVFTANVFDKIRVCQNHCLFCFMDQLPPEHRSSLHLKDDDYRLSFLEGNFITGTNLKEADIQRILELRLSPLFFSIHSTDPVLRSRLIGNPNGAVLPLLERLIAGGIEIHGQIVLCPGVNDGAALAQTLADLERLRPGLLSVAIVPVGLTDYQRREGLRLFTPAEAADLLDMVEQKRQKSLHQTGSAFYFPADEFYVIAGRPFPPYETYEEFPQLENGIGMARLFLHQWQALRPCIPARLPQKRHIGLITGQSAKRIMGEVVEDLAAVENLEMELFALENVFFGKSVTVAGLLTATCMEHFFQTHICPPEILITASMLKHGSDLFLDSRTVADLEKALHTKVIVAEPGAEGLWRALFAEQQE